LHTPLAVPSPSQYRSPRVAGLVFLIGLSLGDSRPVRAWGTPEHIQFGQRIASPFETLLGAPVPVLEAEAGPRTFGHWVSAPDFGRSLQLFLQGKPTTGDLACAVMWAEEGATVGGQQIDDQTLATDADKVQGLTLLQKRAIVDCANGWTVNNNHFGDFARAQYSYYHARALEAARRYRSTRNSTCRSLAYTLEGWGQHYLTDSVAAGHSFNPPGSYDTVKGDLQYVNGLTLNVTTGIPIRMKLHDYLNENGARMAKSLYNAGRFWGDHSEKHTNGGGTVAELVGGSAQRDLTMRLARIGLGQVVSGVECGAVPNGGDVFTEGRAGTDPRTTIYASNETMCQAMEDRQIWNWVPDFIKERAVDSPALKEFVRSCANGVLTSNQDGADFAACYFSEAYTDEGCTINTVIDPKSVVDLDALGCSAGATVTPAPADARDLCGSVVCEVPPGPDGRCKANHRLGAGCCHPIPQPVDSAEKAAILLDPEGWPSTHSGGAFDLVSPGAIPGDEAELLWFKDDGAPPDQYPRSWVELGRAERTISGDSRVELCGATAHVSVYETLVKLPRSAAYADKVVMLTVNEMDEALRVLVDGHLVGHVTRDEGADMYEFFDPDLPITKPIRIPLLTSAAPPHADGHHTVRLLHLNDCGPERPLRVAVSLEDKSACEKCDGVGDDSEGTLGSACAVSVPGRASALGSALLLAVGLATTLVLRARRRPRR
jgi:hypothetical protein